MQTVTIRWEEAKGFVPLEAPLEQIGSKSLMLLAFGQCAGKTLMALMEKMKIPLLSLQLETSGLLTEPQESAISQYVSFRQVLWIECPPEEKGRALHAAVLTTNKYCGVGQMYAHIAPVSYDIIINGMRMTPEVN